MVLGDDELSNNRAKVKNMETGELTDVSLGEGFFADFAGVYNEAMMGRN